jgi:transcriptional regulator with XRE-family HTH domain
MGLEEKVLPAKIGVGAALKLLGERLRLTQDGMARKLGCTFSAYSKWLRGERIPSGQWMLRILALCPDEETWAAFFVDIGEVGSKIRSSARAEVPIGEKEAPHPGGTRASGKLASRYYKPNPNRR